MSGVRVPLAVDAQVRVPLGPILMPLRALILVSASAPVALACLSLGTLSVGSRLGLAIAVMMLGFTLAAPTRDGIWIGTWCLYRLARWVLPTAVLDGEGHRAHVRFAGSAMQVTGIRREIRWRSPMRALRHLTVLPTVNDADAGIVRLNPGGARAILTVEGPGGSPTGEAHARWCSTMMQWLLGLDCPAQFVSVVSNFDSHRAQLAFDERVKGWPMSRLAEMERDLAGRVAEQSLWSSSFRGALSGPRRGRRNPVAQPGDAAAASGRGE